MNRLFRWVWALFFVTACHSPEEYGHLIGNWEIRRIEARGERLDLEEVLFSRKFEFTNRGTYQLGEVSGLEGKWKIVGQRLRMVQPEIIDLNGRVITPSYQQEWELTVSSEWMIWRGTSSNQTQHLKILFHKLPSSEAGTADAGISN